MNALKPFQSPINPKQNATARRGHSLYYPYYAGFSSEFVDSVLPMLSEENLGPILDPWNGAGTTTTSCSRKNIKSIGIDLNPVMALVAKARLLSPRVRNSILPLSEQILRALPPQSKLRNDEPLRQWLTARSAANIRALELVIYKTLVHNEGDIFEDRRRELMTASDLAAFFYVGLFRTLRNLLSKFGSTNPTWVKKPKIETEKIQVPIATLRDTFLHEIQRLCAHLQDSDIPARLSKTEIIVGNSTALPLDDGTIGGVITSPPYCTRIDYAVATAPELALLNIGDGNFFKDLREKMLGTSTVSIDSQTLEPHKSWGKTCRELLEKIKNHPSKASGTYYLKNHFQYYENFKKSIDEISRVLKPGGRCVFVVQTSYYKELLNDLPRIAIEMAEFSNMQISHRFVFPTKNSFSSLNKSTRWSRARDRDEREEVIYFQRI